MKNNIRTILIMLGLIVIGIITSIFTNYASTTVPQVIKDHPCYLWYGIGAAIFLTLLFTYAQSSGYTVKSAYKLKNNTIDKDKADMKKHNADVFICYSSSDRDWVLNEFKNTLSKHGFSVITDTDFKGGSLAIGEMAKAVENTRHTIAVLTPDFVKSKWVKLETAMAQTLDPDASNRKLIPILKQDCDIPLHIQVLHYRDMRNDKGWDELIEDLL